MFTVLLTAPRIVDVAGFGLIVRRSVFLQKCELSRYSRKQAWCRALPWNRISMHAIPVFSTLRSLWRIAVVVAAFVVSVGLASTPSLSQGAPTTLTPVSGSGQSATVDAPDASAKAAVDSNFFAVTPACASEMPSCPCLTLALAPET